MDHGRLIREHSFVDVDDLDSLRTVCRLAHEHGAILRIALPQGLFWKGAKVIHELTPGAQHFEKVGEGMYHITVYPNPFWYPEDHVSQASADNSAGA